MSGATLVAVAVGLVVLVISFGFVNWASKEDHPTGPVPKGQGPKNY